MSSTIATFDAVKAAAEQLVAQNKQITAQSIITITGGSKSTVLPHLRRYREEVASAAVIADAPPAFLYELADPLVRKIWTAAQQEAANSYHRNLAHQTAIFAGLAEENETFAAKEVDYQSEVLSLEEQVANLTSSLAEAEGNIERASVRLDAVSKELAEEKAKLKTAEAVSDSQQKRIERLDQTVMDLARLAVAAGVSVSGPNSVDAGQTPS